ncbi:DUF1772 domain-containing protein [Nocardia brasiliensis]|uniref:DUF1772 domain-containing protein n=1 Tax=Nocardia brasiliensis TaxID=37326 RepID=A0A6G9XSU7_NOCBR|nr:DUF1772 domain-containing protein [Nocardia brasiliensis]QIS03985.1 DUF1772 domain-containing protein [Nocardia brasiliensis]
MLSSAAQIVAIVAVLANAIIYGTDACYALITRSVYARLDDSTLTFSAGWGHYYGDRRMPVFGAGGVITAVLTVVLAAVGGQVAAAIAAGVAVAALAIWLVVYVRVAKPINTVQTAAAQAGATPPNARALQDKWDSVIHVRVALQAVTLAGLGAAIALI